MDPTRVFCPNETCPAKGRIGEGNLPVHDKKKRRSRCKICKRPFSERNGTPFYRLRTAVNLVALTLKWLSRGCPVQALVFALEIDERTVAAWQERGGVHGQAVHEPLVEPPRTLGEVQMDEIRVKLLGRVVAWMAMAIEAPPRRWLGGGVTLARDACLISKLLGRVKRASRAVGRGLLFITEGLASSPTQIKEVFREP